eukprot:14651972-Alexandrium_andersonii.AAC.1
MDKKDKQVNLIQQVVSDKQGRERASSSAGPASRATPWDPSQWRGEHYERIGKEGEHQKDWRDKNLKMDTSVNQG